MKPTSTSFVDFHDTIRAILDDEDKEVHSAYKITEKLKCVLKVYPIPGYKISDDGSGVEPALTPDSAPEAYALLVKRAALMFPRSLTPDRTMNLESEIYLLENY